MKNAYANNIDNTTTAVQLSCYEMLLFVIIEKLVSGFLKVFSKTIVFTWPVRKIGNLMGRYGVIEEEDEQICLRCEQVSLFSLLFLYLSVLCFYISLLL